MDVHSSTEQTQKHEGKTQSQRKTKLWGSQELVIKVNSEADHLKTEESNKNQRLSIHSLIFNKISKTGMQHRTKSLWQYDTNFQGHFPAFSYRLDEESSIISNQIENHDTFNLQSYEEKQINISRYFTFQEILESNVGSEQEFFIEQLKKNDSTFQQHQPEISEEKINSKDKIQSGETKNIPKNFGKQIIKFVNKNKKIVESILLSINSQVKYSQLNTELQKKKSTMNKISDLKNLWLPSNTFSKEMRIISSFFFRKFGVSWIFNSRVTDFKSHLKYRNILAMMIGMPDKFVNLKVRF